MDQTLYTPFVEGIPLRALTPVEAERVGDILLPVVVTHPDVTDPEVVAEAVPQLWPLDTSFDGFAAVDPIVLLSQFHLVARPDNGPSPPASSNKLPFNRTTAFRTDGVGTSGPVHLFRASLWLAHEGKVQFLKTTEAFAVQDGRKRTLLGHRTMLDSGLILEVDFTPGDSFTSVWRMRDQFM